MDRNRYNSLAISLIETRLHEAFPDSKFEIEGTPKTWVEHGRYSMPTHINFKWWAGSLVESVPYGSKKRGAEQALTGYLFQA